MTKPLTFINSCTNEAKSQYDFSKLPIVSELEGVFSSIPYQSLLKSIGDSKVRAFSPLGRPNYYYSESLLRGILLSYYLNLRSTSEIVRKLQDNPVLAIECGFDPLNIPHRSTFSRFNKKLSRFQPLVDEIVCSLSKTLKEAIPDFGEQVAVDSTPVKTYSNPDNEPVSDTEAGWIAKGGVTSKNWVFGYKLHVVNDANHELPIGILFTDSKHSDTQTMLPLLKEAKRNLSWFNPDVITADKGYDSASNYKGIC